MKLNIQDAAKLVYKLRFCRCRGCVAELHRETTDYYTTSFRDFRKIQSCDLFFFFGRHRRSSAKIRSRGVYTPKFSPRCARHGLKHIQYTFKIFLRAARGLKYKVYRIRQKSFPRCARVTRLQTTILHFFQILKFGLLLN